jgi:hypothetical protein
METPTNKLIEAKVQAIDGDRAVLQLADGQIVRWPVSCMNDGVKAGDSVKLSACEIHAAPASQADLAHAVINSIFGQAQS